MRYYYSQNREDIIIEGYFPDIKKGFYIDIGANDPDKDSVTKLFYDKGWSGINVEPIKRHFNDLKKERPRDINVNAGISSRNGEMLFTEYPAGDGLSTFDTYTMQTYRDLDVDRPTSKFKKYAVRVITLKDLIIQHDVKKIHFIKIDVEGYEGEVIKGYDWLDPRPELICIESNHIHTNWEKILLGHDYSLVFFDGLNNYYLAKEADYRREYFNYSDSTLSGTPVLWGSKVEIEAEVSKVLQDRFNKKNAKMQARLAELQDKINQYEHQQRDLRFLAKRLNQEIITRQDRFNKKNAKMQARLAELQDKINQYEHQQRDLRFLAKRLNQEIITRVEKRANSTSEGAKILVYKEDKLIDKMTDSDYFNNLPQIVNAIKSVDKKNVVYKYPHRHRLITKYFWVTFLKLYLYCSSIIRRVVNGKTR